MIIYKKMIIVIYKKQVMKAVKIIQNVEVKEDVKKDFVVVQHNVGMRIKNVWLMKRIMNLVLLDAKMIANVKVKDIVLVILNVKVKVDVVKKLLIVNVILMNLKILQVVENVEMMENVKVKELVFEINAKVIMNAFKELIKCYVKLMRVRMDWVMVVVLLIMIVKVIVPVLLILSVLVRVIVNKFNL